MERQTSVVVFVLFKGAQMVPWKDQVSQLPQGNLLQRVVEPQIQYGLHPSHKTDQIFILPELFRGSGRFSSLVCRCLWICNMLKVDAGYAFITNLSLNNQRKSCVHIFSTKTG